MKKLIILIMFTTLFCANKTKIEEAVAARTKPVLHDLNGDWEFDHTEDSQITDNWLLTYLQDNQITEKQFLTDNLFLGCYADRSPARLKIRCWGTVRNYPILKEHGIMTPTWYNPGYPSNLYITPWYMVGTLCMECNYANLTFPGDYIGIPRGLGRQYVFRSKINSDYKLILSWWFTTMPQLDPSKDHINESFGLASNMDISINPNIAQLPGYEGIFVGQYKETLASTLSVGSSDDAMFISPIAVGYPSTPTTSIVWDSNVANNTSSNSYIRLLPNGDIRISYPTTGNTTLP